MRLPELCSREETADNILKSTAKYSWTKEKELGIKHARKPQEGHNLSGVVLVTEGGIGFCYIKFNKATVEILGRKMPYGIGPENLAYIKVVKMHGHYDVWCCYADKSKSIKLWKSDSPPDWVKTVKFKQ